SSWPGCPARPPRCVPRVERYTYGRLSRTRDCDPTDRIHCATPSNDANPLTSTRIAMTRADDPFDAYLLRVLCTLVAERSVSRTAIKLNQSQPAISAALKRLREIVHDPLLVRDKSAMVPTERALDLDRSARIALEQINRLVA